MVDGTVVSVATMAVCTADGVMVDFTIRGIAPGMVEVCTPAGADGMTLGTPVGMAILTGMVTGRGL